MRPEQEDRRKKENWETLFLASMSRQIERLQLTVSDNILDHYAIGIRREDLSLHFETNYRRPVMAKEWTPILEARGWSCAGKRKGDEQKRYWTKRGSPDRLAAVLTWQPGDNGFPGRWVLDWRCESDAGCIEVSGVTPRWED